MRVAIIAVAMLTCSTWQQIITCSGPGGYVSHETVWNGITTGDDNQGGKWTRSEWQGFETLTVKPGRRGDAPFLADLTRDWS